MHAQKAGNHIDVLDVETGELIIDLHDYIWKASEASVRLRHLSLLVTWAADKRASVAVQHR